LTRLAVALCSLALLAAPLAAEAQPAGKVYRIGILRPGSPPDPHVEAFKQGLRELGYVEGRNISIEYRWAGGRDERLPDLAADLVRLKVDVIFAGGTFQAAKQATTTIPIVMPLSLDPVGVGVAASLARPGGNVTGFGSLFEELPGKWLEILKEGLPRVSRVTVLWRSSIDEDLRDQLRVSDAAARSLGVRLQSLKVERSDDLRTAFAEAQRNRADAVIVLASAFFYVHRTLLVELAAKHRLPTMYP
jgi:putative tryptophan/tyrosine transport system substrate-binding protein